MACTNLKRFIKSFGKNTISAFKKKTAKSYGQENQKEPEPEINLLPPPQRRRFRNKDGDEVPSETYHVTLARPHTGSYTENTHNLAQYAHAPIILDCGTGTIKGGFAVDNAPCSIVPTVLGTPRKGLHSGTTRRSVYVGHSTRQMRGILTYKYPMERGIVTDWDAMEHIIEHCFEQELGIEPSEHPLLLTEIPNNPKAQRERWTQIMFETFHVPAMYLAIHAVLSIYAIGHITGLSLDSGEGITNIAPVYEGHVINKAVKVMHLAGTDLNEYLLTLINSRGNFLSSTAEKELVREIKEIMCYVSEDFEKELNASSNILETSFKLPDGNLIYLGAERFQCPEPLFDPNILGLKCGGIQTNIYQSLKLCDTNLHDTLLKRIVLSGGNTLFRGMETRLLNELKQLLPGKQINLVARPERKYDAWRGGAALAGLSNFPKMCISEEEYYEIGPTIVHRKCF